MLRLPGQGTRSNESPPPPGVHILDSIYRKGVTWLGVVRDGPLGMRRGVVRPESGRWQLVHNRDGGAVKESGPQRGSEMRGKTSRVESMRQQGMCGEHMVAGRCLGSLLNSKGHGLRSRKVRPCQWRLTVLPPSTASSPEISPGTLSGAPLWWSPQACTCP